MGLTWIIGFMGHKDAETVFQALFCALNSFQGFFMFVMYLFMEKETIKSWKNIFYKKCQKPHKNNLSNSKAKIIHDEPLSGSDNLGRKTRTNNALREEAIYDNLNFIPQYNNLSEISTSNDVEIYENGEFSNNNIAKYQTHKTKEIDNSQEIYENY